MDKFPYLYNSNLSTVPNSPACLQTINSSVCQHSISDIEYIATLTVNRMAWQWAETLVEIRGTLGDIRGTTKLGVQMEFSQTWIYQACMFRSASLFIGTSFTVAVFTIFATPKCRLDCRYSPQNKFNAKNLNLFVKCAHLHPGYAANLVARSRYYHCHWTLSIQSYESAWFNYISLILLG